MKQVVVFLICQMAVSIVAAAETMQAAVVSAGHAEIQRVPRPEPQPDQVRIKVRAASVNPVDWKLADRAAPGSHAIAGKDLSGVIDTVGTLAGQWKPGQEVIAIATGGAYAEYALASASAVAAKPTRMSFEEAAGMPVVGETAWRSMVTVANVQPGQRVLIHGGAGGVGSSAVQIAKARGAYVIATASASHAALVRSLGADEVIDYRNARFEDTAKNLDVVLNTVDADTGMRSIGLIKPGGILVSVVGPTPPEPCAAARIRCEIPGPVNGAMLGAISDLANRGQLRIHIDQQLPLAEVAKAWELSRKGHTAGKLILEVGR